MLIVGLQCGHDASVAIISDGRILLHLERERVSRKRHARKMTAELIDEALAYCGLAAADVDYFALCATQKSGYLSETPERLRFHYDWDTAERLGEHLFRRTVFDRAQRISAELSYENAEEGQVLFNSEWPDMADLWTTRKGMGLIDELPPEVLEKVFTTPSLASSQALPMKVVFDGREYPAVGVMHQLSHAASAFYQSGFEAAPVLSHDNGDPVRQPQIYSGGMLFYGEGRRLLPIWTAPIPAGLIYSRAAEWLRLGSFAGPGKLMGLSAYGDPVFHQDRFVGDIERLASLYVNPAEDVRWQTVYGWFNAVQLRADERGYNRDEDAFSAFGKDLAASAQRTFEELVLHVLARLQVLLVKTGRMGPALCLSGGCALNCPANSRIVEETEFTSVFVPPSCDDGGLSIGAALYLHHHVLGHERIGGADHSRCVASLGRDSSKTEIDRALTAASGEFEIEQGIDVAERAAEVLADDRVVALYQGRSESGPRALGHRSLLADPRQSGNWARVNRLKTREAWRPFAPACLSERLRVHFDGGPEHSPHMLFTYRVRSKGLGAITHADGSARTQTVVPGSGVFRDLIEAFDRRTGLPVVLNTSLNGPGEPIVETPNHALDFMRRTDTDVLYIENNRIRRRGSQDDTRPTTR